MVLTVHDITQLKETEKQLTLAKEKAENADLSKSAFLANMSHRNPHASQRHHRICRSTRQCQYRRRKGTISGDHKDECRSAAATSERYPGYVENRSRYTGICIYKGRYQSVTIRLAAAFQMRVNDAGKKHPDNCRTKPSLL